MARTSTRKSDNRKSDNKTVTPSNATPARVLSAADASKAARSEAARLMGSVRSEAKAKAVRENGKKRSLKPLSEIECTCPGEGLEHRTYCKVGRTIRYRQQRGLPLT
jgi:hypothetical protein